MAACQSFPSNIGDTVARRIRDYIGFLTICVTKFHLCEKMDQNETTSMTTRSMTEKIKKKVVKEDSRARSHKSASILSFNRFNKSRTGTSISIASSGRSQTSLAASKEVLLLTKLHFHNKLISQLTTQQAQERLNFEEFQLARRHKAEEDELGRKQQAESEKLKAEEELRRRQQAEEEQMRQIRLREEQELRSQQEREPLRLKSELNETIAQLRALDYNENDNTNQMHKKFIFWNLGLRRKKLWQPHPKKSKSRRRCHNSATKGRTSE